MTKIEELPELPPKELLEAGLPWTSQRMVRQAEPYGEQIVGTVIDLLKFLYQCAGVLWVDPRDQREEVPAPKQLFEYRRWLVPTIREMATANHWCMAAPDITRNMFQETGVDIYAIDGYDIIGFNKDGFDKFGFDSAGRHRDGRMRSSGLNVAKEMAERGEAGEPLFSRSTGLNESGYDAEGYDVEGYDEKGYNKEGLDRWGNKRSDVEPLHWRRVVNKYQPDFPVEKPRGTAESVKVAR